MGTPEVSFEFFPPKGDEGEKRLWNTVKELEPLSPKFVSVTYGAGGSTREKTHEIVVRIKKETKLSPAAHLTCISATKEEIDEIARGYLDNGVNHIVALRGDPPAGEDRFSATQNGYKNATELVEGLRKIGNFEISVAAFPEGHPETGQNIDRDLDYLKAKVEHGATRAITQYFLDPKYYLDFLNKARQKNINIPIIPGIIIISNFTQLKKFSKLCGANIPKHFDNLLNDIDNKPEILSMVSISLMGEVCKFLRQEGIANFHFYTLNKYDQTKAICRLLGVK